MLLDCFNVVLSLNKEYPLLGTISKGDKKKTKQYTTYNLVKKSTMPFENMCYYMCHYRLLCPSECRIDLAQVQVSPVLQPPPPTPFKMLHQRPAAYFRTKPLLCCSRQIEGDGRKLDKNKGEYVFYPQGRSCTAPEDAGLVYPNELQYSNRKWKGWSVLVGPMYPY